MRWIKSSRSSQNRHLNICVSAVGQMEPVGAGVRGLRSGGETGAAAQSAHAALKRATLHNHSPLPLPHPLASRINQYRNP